MHRLHAALRGFGAHSRATFLRRSFPLVTATLVAALPLPGWAAFKPWVQTRAESSVAATGATLNGTVNPMGDAATAAFEYGTTTSFGSTIAASPASLSSSYRSSGVSAKVGGLKCATRYYFRARAANRVGTSQGGTDSFTTSPCPTTSTPPTEPAPTAPAAATNPATTSGTSATLNASVNPNGASTTVSFEHGTTTAYGKTIAGSPSTVTASAGATSISASLASLACGTTYNFRVRATSSAGTAVGGNLAFATAACPTQPPSEPPPPQPVPPIAGKTFYISPAGNNANSGASEGAPFRTFAKAFGAMAAGDRLLLLDGTYSEAAGTGYISYLGAGSAQPPSGRPDAITEVRALNPGRVKVVGGLFIGRSTRKDSHVRIQGITFAGASSLYNADYVTVKDVGINGTFGVGSNDHDAFSDHNLIEDVWIWASEARIIAINYRSHFNVWRRVVVRGDGCASTACMGSGNPNVGITVYDSSDISMQNVIVVDRILATGASPYADFASAQHTADPRYYFGRNEWLGTMSIKAPDGGYYLEPDAGNTVSPTVTIANAVAWDSAGTAMNLARDGAANVLQNLTLKPAGSGDGIRVAPELKSGTLRNALVTGSGRYAVNSSYVPSYMNVSFSATSGLYNQTSCTTGCSTANPSMKHITRIEGGSSAKGTGYGGADVGANVLNRYGAEGSRHGEAGYNTLTAASLWPWPNEDRIKAEMCATTTRGFCSAGKRLDGVNPVTLTSYIWEYLGHPVPAGIYP
jgi:hypothetical protein